ncbi:MAG: type II toxin-antitoxin system RelE/ParE family toxin [Treponema sp.]|nr:type II toxin-antitoxin system RelE/ParE family toxin [Treponema sp.]
MYKIRYLPLALEDLKDIIRYIANTLEAPRAALSLVNKIDKELKKVSANPFRCHVYTPLAKLQYEYRVLNIDNYSLFYVIEKEKVEIHRVLYSKMNITQILV